MVNWIDTRLPIFTMMQKEYGDFPTPKNFNYFWNFGALAMVKLVIMIVTGILLAMNYTPHADLAFDSVERIMRDVNYGWLLRYVHQNGASMFFIVVYIHIFRGLYYGSYKAPRELLWMLGVVHPAADDGHRVHGLRAALGPDVLLGRDRHHQPVLGAFPLVGESIVTWLWGGFAVDNPTLNRFFSLHYLLPFVIFGVVFLHVVALHITGSNNPLGIDPKGPQDTLPFHPYYTIKDSVGLCVFLLVFAVLVFFAPNYLGHPDNYIPANPLVTPPHIVPEWYFLPFYAILRAVPDKLGGVMLMFGSIAVLFVLPWLDTSPVRSAALPADLPSLPVLLVIAFIVLGYCRRASRRRALGDLGRVATIYYFLHFLVLLPLLGKLERPLPLPESIAGRCSAAAARCRAGAASKPMEKAVMRASALVALAVAVARPAPALGGRRRAAGGEEPLARGALVFDGSFGAFDRARRSAASRSTRKSARPAIRCSCCPTATSRGSACPSRGQGDRGDGAGAGRAERRGRADRAAGAPVGPLPRAVPERAGGARRNNGALPPDLSLIVKAREGGADYIYALLTGYDGTAGRHQGAGGMNYNKYFPGHQIAMPPPLSEGQVTYTDGTRTTLEQEAHDVVTFLAWAAKPDMEERKQTGVRVILFLLLMTG